jgi:hypothetical protein
MATIGTVSGFRQTLDSFVVEDENGNVCHVDFNEFERAYLTAKKRRDEAEKQFEKEYRQQQKQTPTLYHSASCPCSACVAVRNAVRSCPAD